MTVFEQVNRPMSEPRPASSTASATAAGDTGSVDRTLLVPWRRLPFPLPWDRLFPGPGPLHLEIGFGDGRYTARLAAERPEDRFVGFEISGASLLRAVRRLQRERLDNVRLLKVGAQFGLRNLFGPASLASITVNFPDPWPKERHHKHRLLTSGFYALAATRLRPGGWIQLATDHDEYFAYACAEAESLGLFEVVAAEAPPAVFETKYALKWRGQGKRLHFVSFVYSGAATPPILPLEGPATMPHALLRGELPAAFTFSKQVLAYGAGHVILHEVARTVPNAEEDVAPGMQERWLVRATIDEPDLRQQLLVVVQRRHQDELIVRLETFGDPIITPTARGAVHAVTEWMLSLGGVRVKERNY